jgi:alpha-L-rhamnosidase
MRPTPIRFEYNAAALGIGVASPRMTWRAEGAPPGWTQSVYEVEATDEHGRPLWTSGRVASAECVLVAWPGPPLKARERQLVRVRVWGADGQASEWSQHSSLEAGLLSPGDWSARFISPDRDEDTSRMQPSPLLRREFDIGDEPVRARLYVTALGLYDVELNGVRVGDHVLAPGWTSYTHRLRYATFDVLSMLVPGRNAVGAILGDGWYRGRIGFPGVEGRNLYGDRLALLAQLEITCADGSTHTIATDETWRSAIGPVISSGIYEGETYDARREHDGRSRPAFDDSGWGAVRVIDRDLGTVVASPGPPVRRHEMLSPVEITRTPDGHALVDFGQNATGRLRINVRGDAGTTITMRHAELTMNGALCTEPLRTAEATDRYTLRGDGDEMWEPRFTFHGFRYAEIERWPGDLRPDDVRAVVCHSDMERIGWFECSDQLVNRLHENAVWSMKSNFLDIPTDCPQRDERLGWTGDLTVFSPAACFLFDVNGFLASWLRDLAADQDDETGVVPIVIPALPAGGDASRRQGMMAMAQAVWGDAAVIVPSVLYERYGDDGVIEAQYDSMRRWVDAVDGLAGPGRLWNRGFQFADWLDPLAPADHPEQAMTDPHLVATAYFFRIASLVAEAAGLLHREDDRAQYAKLARAVRDAFVREYVTPNGRMASDSQTAYALALVFGLLDNEEQHARAGRRLASLVRRNGYRVGTGFVGTALVLDALCIAGDEDAAFRMLTERACPSWLYPVTMGATTIWERWDSLKPDGTLNSSAMTSFNHYALGSVVDWLHRRVGGLAPLAPGYRRFEVRPIVGGGGLTWAYARHRTPYGMASSSWRIEDDRVTLDVTVPPNTSARIAPPGGQDAFDVGSGGHRWTFALSP